MISFYLTAYLFLGVSATVVIFPPPTTMTTSDGDKTELVCNPNGIPDQKDYIYSWYWNGDDIKANKRLAELRSRLSTKDNVTGTIVIQPTLTKDSGYFVCVGLNIKKHYYYSISQYQLTVDKNGSKVIPTGYPNATLPLPENVTTVEGGKIELVCNPKGIPDYLIYQWRFNYIPIEFRDQFRYRYSISNNVTKTIIINSIWMPDSGYFTCIAFNKQSLFYSISQFMLNVVKKG